jgi:ParB-like chromosome segregation protein Spo0J
MKKAKTTSVRNRLITVPLERLHPHPANANVMDEGFLAKLAENIRREGDYPPVVVRPHPSIPGAYQTIDGHQRVEVLRRNGDDLARCYLWPCDDQTALLLLATLNRLHGEDAPAKRAELFQELVTFLPVEALAALLPEDAGEIERVLALLDVDLDALLETFTKTHDAATGGVVSLTFAVFPEDVEDIEAAIARAAATLEGKNRRGGALAAIARRYLETV